MADARSRGLVRPVRLQRQGVSIPTTEASRSRRHSTTSAYRSTAKRSRVPNVRNTRLDSYTVVVIAGPGNSIWAARKRSMIALLSSPCAAA